jgi:FkbM family methyltransferase
LASQASSIDLRERLLGGQLLNSVDVGARGGMQRHWRPFAQSIRLDAYEPDEEACRLQADAKRPNETWFPIGLGRETGTRKLYVLAKASSSSLFPPNREINAAYGYNGATEIARIVDIPLVSLSDAIDKNGRPLPNLMKLDAQGAELDILHGLRHEHWRDLMALQIEVELVEFYSGQPLFHEVDVFMRSKGFIMFDLLLQRRYRTNGRIRHHFLKRYLGIDRSRHDITARAIAGDALYLRPPGEILRSNSRVQFAKLLTVLLIYRCLDEALWFIEAGLETALVSNDEAQGLIDEVRRIAPRPLIWQRTDWLGKLARRTMKRFNIGRSRKLEYWLDRSWDH